MAQVQTQIQIQAQAEAFWRKFWTYTEVLRQELGKELKKRGINVYNISFRILRESTYEIEYEVVVDVLIEEVQKVYYEDLYEACDVGDEVDEETIEKCVEEEIKRYDEEYGHPPFKWSYSKGNVKAELITLIEDYGKTREYLDVLRITFRMSTSDRLLNCMNNIINIELGAMIPEIESLYKSVRAIYG